MSRDDVTHRCDDVISIQRQLKVKWSAGVISLPQEVAVELWPQRSTFDPHSQLLFPTALKLLWNCSETALKLHCRSVNRCRLTSAPIHPTLALIEMKKFPISIVNSRISTVFTNATPRALPPSGVPYDPAQPKNIFSIRSNSDGGGHFAFTCEISLQSLDCRSFATNTTCWFHNRPLQFHYSKFTQGILLSFA